MVAKEARWRDLTISPAIRLVSLKSDGRYELIAGDFAAADSNPSSADVGRAPQLLRQAGVTQIILVHGTFAGNDIIGLVRQVARFSTSAAGKMNQLGKTLVR